MPDEPEPATKRAALHRREGIYPRHTRACGSSHGRACNCKPRYQAQAWSARDNKPLRKTFATLAQARAWRQDTQAALRKGTLRAPTQTTLSEAAEDWLVGAKAGLIRTRSGDPYKPSALRGYEEALRGKLLPALGRLRLSALSRNQVQDLVDRLVAAGQAPSTVRNALLPLRAIYRRALVRQDVAINPTVELELPAVRGRRERIARPAEASALIGALEPRDRVIFATALYAGLRRGELQALRWEDLDLQHRLIAVERSWDQRQGPIAPKSRSGRRRVPLAEALRALLIEQRLAQGRGGSGLAFGPEPERAFHPGHMMRRARRAWASAKLAPIGLHECRHSYAAYMIAAGVNAKALSTYMGHSSITVTLDRYGHLLPGAEGEAAGMLDAYLARASAAGA